MGSKMFSPRISLCWRDFSNERLKHTRICQCQRGQPPLSLNLPGSSPAIDEVTFLFTILKCLPVVNIFLVIATLISDTTSRSGYYRTIPQRLSFNTNVLLWAKRPPLPRSCPTWGSFRSERFLDSFPQMVFIDHVVRKPMLDRPTTFGVARHAISVVRSRLILHTPTQASSTPEMELQGSTFAT